MKRLNAAIDRQGWDRERERLARGLTHVFRDAVKRMIDEAVKQEGARHKGCPNCEG